MAEILVAALPEMVRAARRYQPPFIASISISGHVRRKVGTVKTKVGQLWERIKTRYRKRVLFSEISRIQQHVDAMPTIDERSPDEILGYDEHGLPR